MDKIRTLLWGIFILCFIICLDVFFGLERLPVFLLYFTLFMMFVAALFAFGSIIRPEKSDKNNCCNKKCPFYTDKKGIVLPTNKSVPRDYHHSLQAGLLAQTSTFLSSFPEKSSGYQT